MIEEIKKDLKTLLSEYRYNHSLRVAEVAKDLAKHYKINEEDTVVNIDGNEVILYNFNLKNFIEKDD